MKDKIITAILVLIVGLFLLPLAKFNDQQVTNELKGFSARDIQFIESVGFVDNLDGSWTLTISGLPSFYYEFDFQPTWTGGVIYSIQQNGGSSIIIKYLERITIITSTPTFTIWGGDVS